MATHNPHPEWYVEILEQFDRHAVRYGFPMLDNAYLENADMRLTAFRSSTEWLIAFQQIALTTHFAFENIIIAYGNRLEPSPRVLGRDIVTSHPEQPIWDEEEYFLLDPHRFKVLINGAARAFAPTEDDYRAVGIEPESAMSTPAQILRFLAAHYPDELFLMDDTLLALCGRSNVELERFIQLDDWHHPDSANNELPSENPCLQTLARALAEGNRTLYHCSEETFNTHWSHWVDRNQPLSELDKRKPS